VFAIGARLGFWGFGGHCTTVVTAAISLFRGVIADVDTMTSASATLIQRHGFGTVATISDAQAVSTSESCGRIEGKLLSQYFPSVGFRLTAHVNFR
jgi:hypothetical protein